MTDDKLRSVAACAEVLAEVRENPRPSYDLAGRVYTHAEFVAYLMRRLDLLQRAAAITPDAALWPPEGAPR